MSIFGKITSLFQKDESVKEQNNVSTAKTGQNALQKTDVQEMEYKEPKIKIPSLYMEIDDEHKLPVVTFERAGTINLAERAGIIAYGDRFTIVSDGENGVKISEHSNHHAVVMEPGSLMISKNDRKGYTIRTSGNVEIHSRWAMPEKQYRDFIEAHKPLKCQVGEPIKRRVGERVADRGVSDTDEEQRPVQNTAKSEDKFLAPQRMERGKSYEIDGENLPKLTLGNVSLDLNKFAKEVSALRNGEDLVIGRDTNKDEKGVDFRIAENGTKMIAVDNGETFVSRRHAILSRNENGQLMLMDISTNGTKLEKREGVKTTMAKIAERPKAKQMLTQIYSNSRDGR